MGRQNKQPTPALLRELVQLRKDLTEGACKARAERMARLYSPDGRERVIAELRSRREKQR